MNHPTCFAAGIKKDKTEGSGLHVAVPTAKVSPKLTRARMVFCLCRSIVRTWKVRRMDGRMREASLRWDRGRTMDLLCWPMIPSWSAPQKISLDSTSRNICNTLPVNLDTDCCSHCTDARTRPPARSPSSKWRTRSSIQSVLWK